MSAIVLGSVGMVVAANVAAHRNRLNLGYADLSRRLADAGRTIPVLGLSRIEKGERRVDVDDLVVLAAIFGVTPATLLVAEPTDSAHSTDESDIRRIVREEIAALVASP